MATSYQLAAVLEEQRCFGQGSGRHSPASRVLGISLLPRDTDCSSWHAALRLLAFAYSFRYQLVQGIAVIAQHGTHMCSLEGTHTHEYP